MHKKDMIWIAAASLIYPTIVPTCLVSTSQIVQEIKRLFDDTISLVQLDTHLVSWKDRDADITNPQRGGDRSRYLFKTQDGLIPSDKGDFRLYKSVDGQYDGKDKISTTCPSKNDIPAQFHTLIDWYLESYF